MEDANVKKQTAGNSRLRCEDIMTRSVTAATREMTLQAVARLMREGDCGSLPVVDAANKLVGIVTDRDIVVRAIADGRGSDTEVGDVMTTELYTARADDFVFQTIRLMGDKQIRRVPIVDDAGKLQGILSMADIALETEDEREIAEALEEISSGTAFWRKA